LRSPWRMTFNPSRACCPRRKWMTLEAACCNQVEFRLSLNDRSDKAAVTLHSASKAEKYVFDEPMIPGGTMTMIWMITYNFCTVTPFATRKVPLGSFSFKRNCSNGPL
jgi:hypothetical protein